MCMCVSVCVCPHVCVRMCEFLLCSGMTMILCGTGVLDVSQL